MPKPDFSRPSRAIGKTLRGWREQRGLSLRQVDQASREYLEPVTFDYLSRLERGELMPSIPKLVSLASVYGRSITELIDIYEVEELRRLVPRRATYGTLHDLALESLGRGEITKALACFLGALDLAKSQPVDRHQLASSFNNVGHCLNRSGRYRSAILYLEEGLRVVERPTTRARLLDNLACSHYQLDNLVLADLLSKEAGLMAGDGDSIRAPVLATRASILIDLRRYDEAEMVLAEAIRAFSNIGETIHEIRQMYNLGHCLVLNAKAEEGLKTLRLAVARAVEVGERNLHASSLGFLGRCLFLLGRYDDAKAPLTSSVRIATEADLRDVVFLAAYYRWRIALREDSAADVKTYLEIARNYRLRLQQRSEEATDFDAAPRARPLRHGAAR